LFLFDNDQFLSPPFIRITILILPDWESEGNNEKPEAKGVVCQELP